MSINLKVAYFYETKCWANCFKARVDVREMPCGACDNSEAQMALIEFRKCKATREHVCSL